MDWQQGIALLIVGATAGIFIWKQTRVRRFSFEKETHCGCSARPLGPAQSMHFKARKGERPRIVIKNQ
jgi:hypothetical protein